MPKIVNNKKRHLRVAVTGASGFIGGPVLAELEHCQVEITALTRDASRLQNISSIHILELDITSPPNNCYEIMGSPDVLIHLAWGGLPNYKSSHHFESELPRQYNFLKNLVEAGLPAMLVTGTCFEYGMQSGVLSEERQPLPNNQYGYAKDALRKQLEFLKSATPFNLIWGRLFYMYGERQSATSIYPLLKNAVMRGDKIFNMSGGEQLRDYLPVTEVATRIVQLAVSGENIGIVNICSGQPVSVRRLVEKWLKENNWEIELNLGHYPYPDYEPMAFWGDASRFDNFINKGRT